jgi:hypothetical protein
LGGCLEKGQGLPHGRQVRGGSDGDLATAER